MARTNDPSAATKKAWLTRHRAQEGNHKETVQQRGDFQAAAVVERAGVQSIIDLISRTQGNYNQSVAANLFAVGVRGGLDLPARALKTLAAIEMVTDDQIRKDFKAGKNDIIGSVYNAYTRKVKLNADYAAEAFIDSDEAARLVAHEIGHHVSDWKLKSAAGHEWLALARARKAKISKYAQEDWQEHFAEAFAAYATKKGRRKLKRLEPKTHDFMERLWRDPTMWNR